MSAPRKHFVTLANGWVASWASNRRRVVFSRAGVVVEFPIGMLAEWGIQVSTIDEAMILYRDTHGFGVRKDKKIGPRSAYKRQSGKGR